MICWTKSVMLILYFIQSIIQSFLQLESTLILFYLIIHLFGLQKK